MAKLPRKRIELFGESMPAGEYGLAQFGSLAAGNPLFSTDPEVLQALPAYKQGWNAAVVNEQSPAMEDRNALDYILSYNQVYISQMGIPEWIATQTYYKGSVVTDGNQSIYISLVDNNLNNALTDDIYWARFPTPAELQAVKDSKVDRAGDTMTGNLTVPTLNATTVSASSQITTPTPATLSNDTTVPNTAWVNNRISGGGAVTLNWNGLISWSASSTAPSNGMVCIASSNFDANYYLHIIPAGGSELVYHYGYNNDGPQSQSLILNQGDRAWMAPGMTSAFFVPFL